MPDEPNAITPALTSEEWRKKTGPELERGDLIAFVWLEVGKDLVIGRRYEDYKHFETVTRIAPELMALANYALPDGDQRKITRELWYALDQVVRGQWPTDEMRVDALRVVHILAALLPPEG